MSIIGRKFDHHVDYQRTEEATIIDKYQGIALLDNYGDNARDGRPVNNIISVTYYLCEVYDELEHRKKLFSVRVDHLANLK